MGFRTFLRRDGEYFEVRRNGKTVAAAVRGLYSDKKGCVAFLPDADIQKGDTLVHTAENREFLVSEVDFRRERGKASELLAYLTREP